MQLILPKCLLKHKLENTSFCDVVGILYAGMNMSFSIFHCIAVKPVNALIKVFSSAHHKVGRLKVLCSLTVPSLDCLMADSFLP